MSEIVLGAGELGTSWAAGRRSTLALDNRFFYPRNVSIQGRATHLPFKNKAFGKVYMDFLLNDAVNASPIHKGVLLGEVTQFEGLTRMLKAEKMATMYALLQEAKRILSPTGTISIIDTASNIEILFGLSQAMQLIFQDGEIDKDDYRRSKSLTFVQNNGAEVSKVYVSNDLLPADT